jgi:hypothetical protein
VANSLFNKSKNSSLPLYESATDLANRFNDFFIKKIVNIRQGLKIVRATLPSASPTPQPFSKSDDCSTMCLPSLSSFKAATEQEVKKIIQGSKVTQCSLDPIPTKLLRECIDALLPIITKIVNLSLSEGVMPGSLKKALVMPLLKKVNLNLEVLKNYRPVSNLPYLSKVIERVVAARITDFMETNHLNEILQSAYKKLHSCETALLKVQNDILRAVDDNKCVILVLLDLSAAFDTVDHDKILQILLHRIGITGTALKWFKSYLSDRIQSILIDGVESNVWRLLFGVPQGSVLGPILFAIYTSPLGDILRRHNVNFHFYADDSQLYLSFDIKDSSNAFNKMEECIKEVKAWMGAHFLCLNDSKTDLLVIGTNNMLKKLKDLHLKIGQEMIAPSTSARNIGAWFDNEMSMTEHVSHICKCAWYHLSQVAQIRQYIDDKATLKLMHAFVSSRLDSLNSLLYGIPHHQLEKLQRIQNAAARIIARKRKYDHITPTLIDLHWLPITARIEYKILLMTFKAFKGNAPVYMKEMIRGYKCSRTTRSTNDNNILYTPKTRKVTFGDRAFSHSGPILWNSLPRDIREIDTLDCFKSKLKTFLFKRAYEV